MIVRLCFFCSDIFDWFTSLGRWSNLTFIFFKWVEISINGKLVVWIAWIPENERDSHLGKYPIRIPKPPFVPNHPINSWKTHRPPDLVLENHQVLVASHNRHSIERTIQKMAELGVSQVGVDGRIGAPKRLVVFLGDFNGDEIRNPVILGDYFNRPWNKDHHLTTRMTHGKYPVGFWSLLTWWTC